MEKNIKPEHFEAIKEMMRGYDTILTEMNVCEAHMDKIKERAEKLSDNLSRMREEEKAFFDTLNGIYGPGRFDTKTMSWVNNYETELEA